MANSNRVSSGVFYLDREPDTRMKIMTAENLNSTRAGRSIDNLDDRGSGTTGAGGEKTGNEMPSEKDEVLEEQETEALDHVQVSAIGDVAEDGEIEADKSTTHSDSAKRA
jgi:hypothetical protein